MAFNLFGKTVKTQYVALDIGGQSTKIMLLHPGKKIHINKFMMKPTPTDAFQAGLITDKSVLSDFLAQCFGELELEGEARVVAGISGKGVIAKKIDIPQMEESMIPEFVEIEAEQELFYNKDEMVLDYEVLDGVNFKKPGAPSLLVVTVLNKVVESYNSILEPLSMDCEILDTNFAALFNSFEYNNKNIDENKNYMIVDIGCSSTNLIIVIKKQVVFARNVSLGGDFFNQGIQKKMGVDYQEAEELKINAGKEGESPQELVTLITNELNPAFVEELASCYELYHSLFPEQTIGQMFITGGGSYTLGLTSHLQEKIGVPIETFNPFQNISLSSPFDEDQENLKNFSSVVTGLALRSIYDQN